ncbi:hypothetical protein VO54_03698 [Elizabethkingia miricola]|nr:hypothetical protein VO54_03698 [Elizabethkingia miricola]
MNEQTPLVDKLYILEKFKGKGGWTFACIPEIEPGKNTPFGWVRVCGTIDGYEIRGYNLQPMGNAKLFLPVKAEIRNKIKKQEGDCVHIKLYADYAPTVIPEELKICLTDAPNVYDLFLSYSEGEKKTIIDWIYSAKTDKTKVERIVKIIDQISQKIK